MIAPERPKMFDKSRPLLGEQLGASRTTEVCKNGCMIGFEVSNVAARVAVTPNNPTIPCGSFRKINSLWS